MCGLYSIVSKEVQRALAMMLTSKLSRLCHGPQVGCSLSREDNYCIGSWRCVLMRGWRSVFFVRFGGDCGFVDRQVTDRWG